MGRRRRWSFQRLLVSPETGLARFSPCDAVGVGLAAPQPSSCRHVTGHISHLVTRAGVQEFPMQLQSLIWTGTLINVLAASRCAQAESNAPGPASVGEVVITATRTATTVDQIAVPV